MIDTRYEDSVFRQSLRTSLKEIPKFKAKKQYIVEREVNNKWVPFLLTYSEREAQSFNKQNYRVR